MAHTPKPIRKSLKRLRREGGGPTVLLEEAWTFEPSEECLDWVRSLARISRVQGGRLDPLDIESRGRIAGRLPRTQDVHQIEFDHKREYLEFVERNGGKLINMQSPCDLGE